MSGEDIVSWAWEISMYVSTRTGTNPAGMVVFRSSVLRRGEGEGPRDDVVKYRKKD